MNFTGNRDTDIKILLDLNLKDLRHYCQIDNYANQLCRGPELKRKMKLAMDKVNAVMNFLNHKHIYLHPVDDDHFEKYWNILKNIVLVREIVMDEILFTLDYDVDLMNIFLDNDNEYVLYFIDDENDPFNYFQLTKNQIEEFLLHLYYNKLVVSI